MTKDNQTDETQIALINNNVSYIQKDIAEMKMDIKALAGTFVTEQRFQDFLRNDYALVKRIVYGAGTVIGLAFIGAVAKFFIK